MALESLVPRGSRVFVTGGTGFVGNRLIEVLRRDLGCHVVALAREGPAGPGQFRAAASGAQIVIGSLLNEASLRPLVSGCDAVLHCAYGSHGSKREQRVVTVEGTATLAKVAAEQGVGAFVNLSTLIVTGKHEAKLVDDFSPDAKPWNWPYAGDKRDAERELQSVSERGNMRAMTLRLGPVYGPWGPSFTSGPLAVLNQGRIGLVDEGSGRSNCVYVDDVIQAIIRAWLTIIPGYNHYLITGPDCPSWLEFYRSYEMMLGKSDCLVPLSRQDHLNASSPSRMSALFALSRTSVAAMVRDPGVRRAVRDIGFPPTLMSRLRKVIEVPSQSPVIKEQNFSTTTIPEMMLEYFGSRTSFSSRKATEMIGYSPRFDLSYGMDLTEKWARWAGLVE